MQIEDVQFGQLLQILNTTNAIFTQHEHPQQRDLVEIGYFRSIVIVEDEEDEVGDTGDIGNARYPIVLVVQQPKV